LRIFSQGKTSFISRQCGFGREGEKNYVSCFVNFRNAKKGRIPTLIIFKTSVEKELWIKNKKMLENWET